ncbi:PepSY domain-containing protein [Sporosarcina sp. FSL W8-0480]|uniref:PepSY domain-containing protein n=1 Tax=Sporosarcina sp. FSL W8-0480 TaxID=2954701 RepID=UPI0030D90013
MDILKKPWFIPIVLTIIIVIAGQLYTSGKLTKAETLTIQEIHSQLEEIYKGEVSNVVLDGSFYNAKVVRDGSEYEVKVEAETGKVLSLIQTKETTQSGAVVNNDKKQTPEERVTPPEKAASETGQSPEGNTSSSSQQKPKPKSKPSTPANEQKTVLISEKQAANIGMSQLPSGMIGEVDDVEFVKTTEGGYYLVQIDIDTEDDLDEVTYQIHAISGKVLTVTWDD